MATLERGRVVAAELGEHASDLVAEVRAEYEQDLQHGRQPDDHSRSGQTVDLRVAAGSP